MHIYKIVKNTNFITSPTGRQRIFSKDEEMKKTVVYNNTVQMIGVDLPFFVITELMKEYDGQDVEIIMFNHDEVVLETNGIEITEDNIKKIVDYIETLPLEEQRKGTVKNILSKLKEAGFDTGDQEKLQMSDALEKLYNLGGIIDKKIDAGMTQIHNRPVKI